MAQFKQWFEQDFTEKIEIQHCESVMFTGDDKGALVCVRLFDNGEAYSGGGTVSGAVKRSDGGLVALTGTLSGNAASVVIPSTALAYPGPIGVRIILTQGGSVTTVLKAIYSVDDNTGAAVDPGTIIPSVNDLITAINTAVASIPSDYSALLHTLAPDFSASTAYYAGDYVWYSGTMYRFLSDHPAGSWIGTDAVTAIIGSDISALGAAANDMSGNLLTNEKLSPGSRGGMNFTPIAGGGIIVYGTQSAMTFYNLYVSGAAYPTWLQKGAFYSVSMSGTENQSSPKVVVDIYGYNGTSTQEILLGAPIGSGPYVWYVPPTTDYAGLIIRIRVNGAISNYHAQVYPKIELLDTRQYIPKPFNSADITPAVVSALTTYNEVEFGPGTFEITQAIPLPNGAVVHGQGENSVLKPVNIEYVFNTSRENEVFSLCFNGGNSSVSIDTPGYGSGLYYYRATQDESTDGKISFVHNCWFKNLPYCGIYGQNTGGGTNEGLHVDSCYFEHCWCAIDIYLKSEYWVVSNCSVYDCTYGVINDGGNNKFVNCTFRTNNTAFYLNTEGAQIYNDGHGQCIGCSFNHIGGNGGIAIKADRLLNGYTFIGCHFFYSVINISNSKGVHIVGCTLGQSTPQITVTGSYPAFVEDCVFTVAPTLSLNAATKVVGCYTFDGDQVTNG